MAGSSGHVAATAAADEEVFGPKLLEQILLCSIVQTQFPPVTSLSPAKQLQNYERSRTRNAARRRHEGGARGSGSGCRLSCKAATATWCQQLEKFRPNCQWKAKFGQGKEGAEEVEGEGKLKINSHDGPKLYCHKSKIEFRLNKAHVEQARRTLSLPCPY